MTNGRYAHTSTLLLNGKVLVAGGSIAGGAAISSAELYDPATGTWTGTGSMTTARTFHTATLLPNGKVLVVGGSNSGGSVATAEIYNPATGTWTATATNMANKRSGHTATLLSDGRSILITGGLGTSTSTNTTEIYDYIAATWTTKGNMGTARQTHTATLLPNGKVLVVGGQTTSAPLNSAELYNPATGTWSGTGSLTAARQHHSATLLRNGKVLAAAGTGASNGSIGSAELYDPAAGTWSMTGSLGTARTAFAATLLPNGKLLVAGGYNATPTPTTSAELYDPAVGTWSGTGAMNTARVDPTATLLANGRLLVTGGFINTSGTETKTAEYYDSANGAWSNSGNLDGQHSGRTITLLPSGKVLAAGGTTSFASILTALYDPAAGTWSAAASLPTARANFTATLLASGKVIAVGGLDSSNSGVSSAFLYDAVVNQTWSTAGSMSTPRVGHTATLLANGQLLVAGGSDAGGTFWSSCELYNPSTGTWSATGSLATARATHTATLLPNGKVLVVGGGDSNANALNSAELYDPVAGTWSTTGSLAGARSEHTATLLPNGKVLVAGGRDDIDDQDYHVSLATAELYDAATGTFSNAGSMATSRIDHSATLLRNGIVVVAGGHDIPGNCTASAELYDPMSGNWSTTASLGAARANHAAALLLNGKLLVAGGYNAGGFPAATELYDVGLGFVRPTWQPQISSFNVSNTGVLTLAGSLFEGLSQGSSGGVQDSSTNYPLVQIRSVDSGQSTYLPIDPSSPWSNTASVSDIPATFPTGQALVMVTADGIPSDAVYVYPPSAPVTTSANSTTFTVGTSGSFQITTSGYPANFNITSVAAPLPVRVTLSSAGLLSGTPAVGTGGVYSLTFRTKNGVTPDEDKTFTLTVNEANSFTSTDNTTFLTQTAGTFTVTTLGYPTPTLSATGNLPQGITFDPSTGILSGTPHVGGSYPLTFNASNGGVTPDATQSFTLIVNQPPAFLIGPFNFVCKVGVQNSTPNLNPAGYPAPTLSVTGTLPAGIALSVPGEGEGGPHTLGGMAQAGTGGSYPFTLHAVNTVGSASQSDTVTVYEAPGITFTTQTSALVGAARSFSIAAGPAGYPLPATYGLGGTIPGGLSFNPATGLLSGTPAAGSGGVYNLTMSSSNGQLGAGPTNLQLTVSESPSLTNTSSATFTVGTNGSLQLTASGYPSTFTYSNEGAALPSGVSLTAAGVLSGTPAAGTGGVYHLTFQVSNGVSPAGTQNFTLTINESVGITSANGTTFTVGTAGTFTATASGYPIPTWSVSGSLPGGVSLDSATGIISGTPQARGGQYQVTLTASNGIGTNATQTFTLTLNEAPRYTGPINFAFKQGVNASVNLTGDGYPAPTFSITGTVPSGIGLGGGGGQPTLAGNPGHGSGGDYPVTIIATNSVGSDSRNVDITVIEAPNFAPGTLGFHVGQSASGSIAGPIPGYPVPGNYSMPMPNGVTLNSTTGSFSGTPLVGSGHAPRNDLANSSNAGGTATGQASIQTTVFEDPSVDTQPTDVGVCAGQNATFTAHADTSAYPSISATKWQLSTDNGANYTDVSGTGTSGSFTATLTLNAVTVSQDQYLYRAVFSSAASGVSNGARLSVSNPVPAATITPLPTSVDTNSAGNTATAPAGVASYSWTITNGIITSAPNAQTITYIAGPGGNVTLDLTIANGTGCSASTELLVPTNPRITSFIRANPVPTITFTSISGHNYAVERKDVLSASSWTTVTNAGSIPGTDNPVTITDPDASAGNLPKRFYHVVLLP